jgi:hypothetical protein
MRSWVIADPPARAASTALSSPLARVNCRFINASRTPMRTFFSPTSAWRAVVNASLLSTADSDLRALFTATPGPVTTPAGLKATMAASNPSMILAIFPRSPSGK